MRTTNAIRAPMSRFLYLVTAVLLAMTIPAWCGAGQPLSPPLEYHFTKGYGQVEVGGPFAGAEFHESRPLPSRISWYYPVANSIDLSTDYWKRGDSRPMAVGIRIDGGSPEWIGRDAWDYTLSPQRVSFDRRPIDGIAASLRYEFGLNQSIMAMHLVFTNLGATPRHLTAYVHLKTALRTCQTYARFDSALMSYDQDRNAVIATFPQPQTGEAAIIVENMGAAPSGWECDAGALAVTDSGTSNWNGLPLRRNAAPNHPVRGCAAFTYERDVAPGDSLAIVLVIASYRSAEGDLFARRLVFLWKNDVHDYDRAVEEAALRHPVLTTGDPVIDRSSLWARALLTTNAHYLDGRIVPMPCPAEYNFFFTHDMLLTDLAAIAFDPARVRRDLLYIAGKAKGNVIPHAYYWRDDGFKTEYCAPDNWNHFWFLLVAGTYFRHTGDAGLVRRLYPLLTESINSTLKQLRDDHLMYAGAPDWWDIGKAMGPRSYMTILGIRAIREYTVLSAALGKYSPRLAELERTTQRMEQALTKRLWDGKAKYLINFNGGTKDPHYYMGSLLAPCFGYLDSSHAATLLETADRELLAPGIGIRTAMPADFHTDSIRAEFHFVDNEAGNPYLYANGGVWPHNNAWYVLALSASGRRDEAFRFFRSTMTLDGVANSPMGQPAFYEYRYSDTASPAYGKIDKPSFLWAAGFSLLAEYRLLGFEESAWNMRFASSLPSAVDSARCRFEFRGAKNVALNRSASGYSVDGRSVPSRVVPLSSASHHDWVVGFGAPATPVLLRLGAMLDDVRYDETTKQLLLRVSSFEGHQVEAEVAGPSAPHTVTVDGNRTSGITVTIERTGVRTRIRWEGKNGMQTIVMQF